MEVNLSVYFTIKGDEMTKKLSEYIKDKEYDCTEDTQKHIDKVNELADKFISKLSRQVAKHDQSKLYKEEKPLFDEMTPKLKGMTYGSDEYKECLKKLKPALDHHYGINSHHPEHFKDGMSGMNLLDLIQPLTIIPGWPMLPR